MSESDSAAKRFVVPVVAGMATVSVLNGLWSLPSLELYNSPVPHALGVYLPTALVALGLLWWVLRQGTVTSRDVGLDVTGWTAPKRLFAAVLIVFMGYGGYATLERPKTGDPSTAEILTNSDETDNTAAAEQDGVEKPPWGDYCFWFVFLLSASLVELLVFICLGFCIPERWLREKIGLPPWAATLSAALFAAFMFGIYHYTHEPRFWGYVYWPLMPVMLLNLTCFIVTRNFHLALILHNCFAAVGFTEIQYGENATGAPAAEWQPAFFLEPSRLSPLLVSFLLPYLLLLWIEYRQQNLSGVGAPAQSNS